MKKFWRLRPWQFKSLLVSLALSFVILAGSGQPPTNIAEQFSLQKQSISPNHKFGNTDKTLSVLSQVESKLPEATNFESQSIKVAVISDLNSQYGSTDYEPEVDKAIALIVNRWQPDLVLGGGDAIAGQKKSLTKSQIEAMWQAFDSHIAKPLRDHQIPYAFTIGNHDGSGAIKQNQFVFEKERDLAAAYWQDPSHDSGIKFVDRANFPFYYSFEQNKIFYLVWDASTHIIDPQQLTWVEKSLASSAAQTADLRMAIGHLPLYPVAEQKNKPGEYLAGAERLRALLEKYQVHTYISGHHHAYYPGKKGKLELLFAGAIGQGARKLIGSNLHPQQTVTLISVKPDSQNTLYVTYDLQTLQKVNTSILPKFIISNNALISRRDQSDADFSAKLYQLCKKNNQQSVCRIEHKVENKK